MAATVANITSTVFGDRRAVFADVTIGTYATSGVTFTPSSLGLSKVDYVDLAPGNVTTTYYNPQYDYTNNKILVATGAAQVADTTDLSGLTVRGKFIGK